MSMIEVRIPNIVLEHHEKMPKIWERVPEYKEKAYDASAYLTTGYHAWQSIHKYTEKRFLNSQDAYFWAREQAYKLDKKTKRSLFYSEMAVVWEIKAIKEADNE